MTDDKKVDFAAMEKEIEEGRRNTTMFSPDFEPEEGDLPIAVKQIKFCPPREGGLFGDRDIKPGQPVSVRWCSEPEKDENGQEVTRFGFYLGDLPLSQLAAFDKRDDTLSLLMRTNPAILVPALRRIVWGCESWWGPIKDEEGLKKITDKSISDLWYVKAMKAFAQAEEKQNKST